MPTACEGTTEHAGVDQQCSVGNAVSLTVCRCIWWLGTWSWTRWRCVSPTCETQVDNTLVKVLHHRTQQSLVLVILCTLFNVACTSGSNSFDVGDDEGCPVRFGLRQQAPRKSIRNSVIMGWFDLDRLQSQFMNLWRVVVAFTTTDVDHNFSTSRVTMTLSDVSKNLGKFGRIVMWWWWVGECHQALLECD